MASSNSWDYGATAADLVQAVLEDIGKLQPNETVSTYDSALVMKRLNFVVKRMQGNADMSMGLKLWTRQRITLFLAKGQQSYTIGPAATDSRATLAYGRTTISATEAAAQTTLSITAITDTTTYPGTTITMTAADIIGIVLDDGTIQWSTISSTGAGPTVVIPATGLISQASAGNYVYWFTSRAQRFPVLEFAVLRDRNIIDTQLLVYTDVKQYEGLPDKTADGDPCSILCEPLRLNTRITTDFQPIDVTKQIRLTAFYPAEDYDATTNDITFPQEWFSRLEWETALACCPAFEVVWTAEMQKNYDIAYGVSSELNPQVTSSYFQPGMD